MFGFVFFSFSSLRPFPAAAMRAVGGFLPFVNPQGKTWSPPSFFSHPLFLFLLLMSIDYMRTSLIIDPPLFPLFPPRESPDPARFLIRSIQLSSVSFFLLAPSSFRDNFWVALFSPHMKPLSSFSFQFPRSLFPARLCLAFSPKKVTFPGPNFPGLP